MHLPLRPYFHLLRTYLAQQWGRVGLLAALVSGGLALGLYQPLILRDFLDNAMEQVPHGRLVSLALTYLGVALTAQVAVALTRFFATDIAWVATNRLREDLTEHCLKLDLSFHKSKTPGELIQRIDSDVNQLSTFFSQLVVELITSGLLVIGILAMLFREDWRAGGMLTLFVIIAMAVLMKIREVATPHQQALQESQAKFFGFLGERLAGTEDIRANGSVPYTMRRFYEHLRTVFATRMKGDMGWASMWISTMAIFGVGLALALSVGAYLWSIGAISVGTVFLIFNYTQLLRQPMEQIRTQFQNLQRAGAAINRVQELKETQSRLVDGDGAPLPNGALSVDLEQVSFGYEQERVIENLTLNLAPGRKLGLLGRTGAGKSTIARLLLRFYDVGGGSVRLGGVDVRQPKLKELRRRVAMVTQDVQLFGGTIRDNLTLFDSTVQDQQIREAVEAVGLGEWLSRQPVGLDTELEAGGAGLSAGEAQLLALARIFLSDPGLVILDEASSRLDPATEKVLDRALERLLAGRTAVIIAHRLTTVQRVDEILILEQGQVLEHGARQELAAREDSRFARLLRTGVEEWLV